MPNTPKRLTPEAVTRWRRKDTWTIYETAFLLCGYEPPTDMRAETQTPDEVRETAENMGRARIAGHLRTIGPEDDNGRKYMLRQHDVVAWAASAYPEFPLALKSGEHTTSVRTRATSPLPAITLPAGTLRVPTMALPALIAEAFHPGVDPNGTEFQAALRSHTRMLNKAARNGTVRVVSYHGEPITIGTEDAATCAGAFLAVSELERYLAELAVPLALRIGEPEVQGAKPPARALQVSEQHAEIVLAALRAAAYDPLALPPRKNGSPTAKKDARAKCKLSPDQFDRAWKALRADGRIKERE